MIKEIKEKSFKKLYILLPKTEKISDISKSMIFVNKIEDVIKIAQYNLSSLLEPMCKKKH